ncbi:MAG: asparagine synthase (glutamine-hydrolyzing), partial [Planctomycetes bacterium]|nr:asparagine synthase (glutamine-hydrolyzing) [Planctomycetota bacterium]
MCGFVGAYHSDGAPVDLAALHAATRLVRHRGPDDSGFLLADTRQGRFTAAGDAGTDPRLGLPRASQADAACDLAFGFRRLAILDLSLGGHQPMSAAEGRLWIVFNGEIYNYRELRDQLRGHGWRFRTESDTEVLLTAYRQWGEECLDRLNGMFAFLIWDQRARRLFGARDRFGEKPFYYAACGERLYFASEIKSLVRLLPRRPDSHPGVIRDYVQDGLLDHSDATFFQGIHSLPAAHQLTVERGAVQLRRYWELREREPLQRDSVEAFREALFDAVRLRMRSDVPVGACLSGGLDSGAIACIMGRLAEEFNGNITRKTFTAAYPEFDEQKEVELVNAGSGSQGWQITPQPASLDDLATLLRMQDEPIHSFNVWSSHRIMELARREGVIVLLNGQGADELLAGYRKYFPPYLHGLLRSGRIRSAYAAARDARPFTGEAAWRCLAAALASAFRAAPGASALLRLRESAGRRDYAVHTCGLTAPFLR